MMKILSGYILLAILTCALIMSSGCSASKSEGFAVYLTAENIPPAQMPTLSHVEITETPVIAVKDIIAYDPYTHEITLTADAFASISQLEVPVSGKSFVVCVDKQVIYWGAFWTPISSLSFDGIIIGKPLGSQATNVIQIEQGYPSSAFYGGEDPRSNAQVMASLKNAGKLSSIPQTFTVDTLPHSMKGYELYSWPETDQWHFTLITGTNRNKTIGEIISIVNTASGDEWVHLHVVGTDAIKSVLGKIPPGESIFWLGEMRTEDTSISGIYITLPSEPTVNAIKDYAVSHGLNLAVATP